MAHCVSCHEHCIWGRGAHPRAARLSALGTGSPPSAPSLPPSLSSCSVRLQLLRRVSTGAPELSRPPRFREREREVVRGRDAGKGMAASADERRGGRERARRGERRDGGGEGSRGQRVGE
eukprot:scaffold78940_cov33-Tisochrysis_lutea.AAC.5